MSVTLDKARECLNYDPETGALTWKAKVASKTVVGRRAGWSQASKGKPYLRYRFVALFGVTYSEHRLIWFLVHGVWPTSQIDHINGDGEDNRINNLREAQQFENNQNTVRHKPSKSGVTGVHWHAKAGKWESKINYRGGTTYLGLFESVEAARDAYLHAKSVIHTFNPVPRTTKTKASNDQTYQTAARG